MENIDQHIQKDEDLLSDPTISPQARRHTEEELEALKTYKEHHPEDSHDPTPLGIYPAGFWVDHLMEVHNALWSYYHDKKKEQQKALDQNEEEVFSMAYAANYSNHAPIIWCNEDWSNFMKKLENLKAE